MALSFIRDTQLPGEYFVRIETSSDGAAKERKLVPALDIKQILAQSLSFTIFLQDDCADNDYDLPEEKALSRRQSLLALNPMKLFSKDKDQAKTGTFPMTFESEYAPKIVVCFRKLQTLALERAVEIQQAGETQHIETLK